MELLWVKLAGMLGLFGLMLAGVLLPVRLLLVDRDKAHRYRRPLSLCNAFGGVSSSQVSEVMSSLQMAGDYPVAETMMMLGFFLTVFVEQTVLTFRKERPSFINLETFNAGGGGSEAGSDSEYDTPFISSPAPHRHSHSHLDPARLASAGPLRLVSLVLALSAHSVFEGLALGLQDRGDKLGGLFLGVAVHETLAAVALGVSVAKASLPMRDAAKLGATVSTLAGSVVSAVLQGLAAGTFLFVTFFEILAPELEEKEDRLLKVLFLVLGYGTLAADSCATTVD
uniref:Zinc transporter ZIP3 n=1 Tax=Neogobius melanostomus TaxID=47308 RepID=A0A8C6U362_9GOBI